VCLLDRCCAQTARPSGSNGAQALSSSTSALSNKKQREVYVGNLTIGVVTDIMLRDLFNASLAHLCGIDYAPGQDISGALQHPHPQ
jgi:hypothetical protein